MDLMRYFERMCEDRRWLHRHPEIDFALFKTSEYVINVLSEMQIFHIEVFAGVGVRAVLLKDKALRTVAFRSDMDALSITETTDAEYASIHKGCMHACGHDGHMAILLGFARWIADHREHLLCNVVLIFQPAEESVGGALPMIEQGVLENPHVDTIYGFHIYPSLMQGQLGLREGALMSQASEFDIHIDGMSAHGARPHEGKDALLAACSLVCDLQKIISREIPAESPAVLTIGKLRAGDRRNIVAASAVLEGTLRTYDEKLYEFIKNRILDMLASLEKSCRVNGCYEEKVVYPVLINDSECVGQLRSVLKGYEVVCPERQLVAEDFSYYLKRARGALILLGSGNIEKGYVHPLHSSDFDFDEKVLLNGLDVYMQILLFESNKCLQI